MKWRSADGSFVPVRPRGFDPASDLLAFFTIRFPEFILQLQPYPKSQVDPEELAELDIIVGGATTLSFFHFGKV